MVRNLNEVEKELIRSTFRVNHRVSHIASLLFTAGTGYLVFSVENTPHGVRAGLFKIFVSALMYYIWFLLFKVMSLAGEFTLRIDNYRSKVNQVVTRILVHQFDDLSIRIIVNQKEEFVFFNKAISELRLQKGSYSENEDQKNEFDISFNQECLFRVSYLPFSKVVLTIETITL